MPSLAIPLWLIFAAAAGSDPLSPAARGREPAAPDSPATPTAKAPSAPAKPSDTAAPKSPVPPAGKPAARTSTPKEESATAFDEPEEEIYGGARSKGARRPPTRKAPPSTDHTDIIPERKASWATDRYAAVVPPGLTLSALRSQLAKAQGVPAETAAPAAEQGPSATLADIERAREALRQETARLEALLKASGNCGGGSMPIGDGLATPTAVSPSALREAPTEQIDSVSKAMKGMKPEQAAALMARLDRGLAAEIMRRMKPVDAGAILGLVKPELAAELATQIATRKSAYGKDKKGTGK